MTNQFHLGVKKENVIYGKRSINLFILKYFYFKYIYFIYFIYIKNIYFKIFLDVIHKCTPQPLRQFQFLFPLPFMIHSPPEKTE